MSPLPFQLSDSTQRLELEYGWQILVDPQARMQRTDAERSSGWRNVRVGLSWNAQFADLRDYMGAAWYRVSFELPAFRETRHVLLKFGAIDYFCEIFLNGILMGSHEGGYTPFTIEITSAIRHDKNDLMIRVIDPPMDEAENRALFPEMMYNEIPHGKQNWYVQNSGIWQGVRVESCPSIYIERLDVTPQADGNFEISARLAGVGLAAQGGALAREVELQAEIYDSAGRLVWKDTRPLERSSHNLQLQGKVQNPHLWSPENPELYSVQASLNGSVQYRRRTRFGFRSFSAGGGNLYLNGKRFFMVAALDQDFYPETVHSPTSEVFVRDMMAKAKRLGFNVLRCHLKVAHPVYLDVADELGMLIWTELPSWSDCWFPADHFSTMAAVRADKMFWEILIRDWNHPCIVLQTIMNESWGINLNDASQREWLRTTFSRIKGLLAPLGRLVIDNSPCEGNFHVKTDIEDFHQYCSMPDQVELWDKWLAEMASRPAWTFSPHGDAERSGAEPLVISEFGNWGLPKLPEELPWWFGISFGDREITRPAGVLDRFRMYRLDDLFGTFNQLAEETQWHQFISLKYEIESIRWYASLQGYVITGITDVHWEVNGILDMWRNEKVYTNELSALQQPDVVLCKLPRHSFWGGERIEIATALSHFSDHDLSGARVRWSTSSSAGQFPVDGNPSRGAVISLKTVVINLPEVNCAQRERLEIEVRLKNGHRVAENAYDLFLLPKARDAHSQHSILLRDKFTRLAPRLAAFGHNCHAGNDHKNTMMIAGRYDSSVAAHLESGGSVLLIADSDDALPPQCSLKITKRAGNELDGRWFSNFNWNRRDRPPFSHVAFSRILGFESAAVVPHYVVQNISPEDFDDVLSGITLAWLNRNAALAANMRVGNGKLFVTTYRFDSYGVDPYATYLFDSIIRYMLSAEFTPRMELQVDLSDSEHMPSPAAQLPP